MSEMISVGYHRVSDDSVNSALLLVDEAKARVDEMMAIDHYDVDHIWTRNTAGEVTWEWFRSTDESPVEGPAQLVEFNSFPWTDDFSWMRLVTCRNHPTAVYYTKNIYQRSLLCTKIPEGIVAGRTLTGECPCPVSDLVVVVAPGSDEESDLISRRIEIERKEAAFRAGLNAQERHAYDTATAALAGKASYEDVKKSLGL